MVKIGNIELPDFPFLLAPMEDVSDPPFRRLCKLHGADLMYSEFISSEGLIRDAMKSRKKLDIFDYERPVGIQMFGGDEEAMAMSARIVETVNPDIVDINFGCPVEKLIKGAFCGDDSLLYFPKGCEYPDIQQAANLMWNFEAKLFKKQYGYFCGRYVIHHDRGCIVYYDPLKLTYRDWETDRKSTRLNSSHRSLSRMPSSA